MTDTHSQRSSGAGDAPRPDDSTADSLDEHSHNANDPIDNHPHDAAAPHPRAGDPTSDSGPVRTDGGQEAVDYLDREVNIFKPSTPFMRDHLRVVWTMFALWAVVVFGPVTATALAPETMTSITVIGFPLHYLLTAIGAPGGALVLSFVYARRRDQLDAEYGIDHGADATAGEDAAPEPAATDGGSPVDGGEDA
jgi:putative solute:sodium symporter small subunit